MDEEEVESFLNDADPDTEIAEGVNLGDLIDFINKVIDEELEAIDFAVINPSAFRELIEKITLKVALATVQLPQGSGTTISHVLDRDDVAQFFAALMHTSGVNLRLTIE